MADLQAIAEFEVRITMVLNDFGGGLARVRAIGVLICAAFILFGSSAQAQISLVQVTSCGKTSFPTACPVTASGTGNLIVVAWVAYSGYGTNVVSNITDNAGNTYVQAPGARVAGTSPNYSIDFWYAKNSKPGAASITVTPNATSQGGAVIWEFSGVDPVAPLDQAAVLTSQTATTNPLGAPIAISSPSKVILSATLMSGTSGIHAGNPFIADSTMNGDGYAHVFASSTGTYQAQWDDSLTNFISSAVSFKAASSSGALSACDLSVPPDGVVNILDVNKSVNMALGLSACTANINGPSVCSVVTVQRVVNASLPGGSCVVDAASVTPTALSCSPSNVNAPGTSSCTGTLSGAAPSGGVVLALSSNNANVIVPSTVTATSGATTFAFTPTVGSITSDQVAQLTVSANGASLSLSLGLTAPAQLSAVSCSPASLGSGQASTCTVTLSKIAAGAMTVSLSSNLGTLSIPSNVTINGASSGTFTATAGTIGSNQTATITAGLNGINKTATISLTPTAISHSVTLSWDASTSPNIAGYNVYRGSTSGGPYTKINASLIGGLGYVDTTVMAGQAYYYVGTAVGNTGAESSYSNQTQGTVPTP